MMLSLIEVCQEWGVLYGGTWRILRVPDWRHGWQGNTCRHEWCSFTLRNIPWKFCVNISIRSVSRRGVKKGVTWRMLRVPDQWLGWHGHSWSHEWCSSTPRKIPWKFCVDISIRSVSEWGVKKGGTWRTLRVPDQRHGWQGHSWRHEWCSFTLRNLPWKFQINIFICCEVIRDLGVNGQLP